MKDKLDGRGNYTIGLAEQSVFPEIDFDKLEFTQGHGHHLRDHAKSDERGTTLCSRSSACPSGPRRAAGSREPSEAAFHGQDIPHRQGQQEAEVQDAGLHVRRCGLCGRPRAVYRKFGICRICLRERALLGQIPGMRKASW